LVLPENIKLHPKLSEESFFSFLKERKGLLDGIVICGGEPTCQPDLPKFIGKIKEMGFDVKLDTNGANPQMIEMLISDKLVDYIAMDVKAPREKYKDVVGVDVKIKDIEKSINILKENRVDYEFRTTVVPKIHSKEDILEIAKWLGPAKRYYLQNFRPEKTINPEFESVSPYPKEFLLEIKREIAYYFEVCDVRG